MKIRWPGVRLVLPSALAGLALGAGAARSAEALPELRTASEVRELSPEQAARHYPVRLTGILTFVDEARFYRFIQDESAGVYFLLLEGAGRERLVAGMRVELEGHTDQGEYAPVVRAARARVLGPAEFPAPRPVSYEQLASGQEDSQFVRVRGIVRSAQAKDGGEAAVVEIATGGGRLTAQVRLAGRWPAAALADSTVLLNGVVVTRFNHQRQLFDIRLLAPRPEDFQVLTPGPPPFSGPAQSIASLLRFRPQGPLGRRVKVEGTVIGRPDERTLYIQDQAEGLEVETRQTDPLEVGDRIEVTGFPAPGDYTPRLEDAIYRKLGPGAAPAPLRITTDDALRGACDCRLAQLEGKLLDQSRHSRERSLVMQSGGVVFHAVLPPAPGGPELPEYRRGSRLRLTGICRLEPVGEWHAGEDWRANSFRLLLRSPADVVLVRAASWWTLPRLLGAVGALLITALAALAWVLVLRQRVRRQTGIIARKFQAEAALQERYLDLFENANDMVYTHDETGRMTSINRAGEELLQLPRTEILRRDWPDLVLPEQRAAAREWIRRVMETGGSGAAEWDFAVPGGAPARIEVSARRIQAPGRAPEIEGIARDITARKRLEREILEISSREQRRIGHDLHGVCQELVGISFLAESLADRLRERGAPESEEVERLSELLGRAIVQTRGVARGLSPVRLEENGLLSALEELGAHLAEIFEISCEVACESAPETFESGVALNVFYIAHEAMVNAARHGGARRIRVELEQLAAARWSLTVRDDGRGFAVTANPSSGMGLRIMHYRARLIGGSLELASTPGAGTTVACLFRAA